MSLFDVTSHAPAQTSGRPMIAGFFASVSAGLSGVLRAVEREEAKPDPREFDPNYLRDIDMQVDF
ncbi:hypothetical protein DEA8626_01487 [Defluviimonas aquaemixtae]|uniref:Uncharacterized protein n=1 Tax=Albidovulum aquaemixtae TaxID=1542388 RepID=A0A2R8B5N6_9RHOB|nr:hypothetical protein [Defluviimonas aquaemixtae]SPH17958.1 hypothetical protein DEA8626_01487 [Defluviimonas aquaemixtae]